MIPSTGCVTSFRVVVGSISTLDISVVVLAAVVVTEVAAGFNVTRRRGIAVVAVVGTSSRRVSGVSFGEVFAGVV